MSIIINGYRTKENISNSAFEEIQLKIRNAINEKQQSEYINLLSEEVNLVADYYILDYINIYDGKSVLDIAQERIAQRVNEASRNDIQSRYNFHICIEVMSYEKRWYFLIASFPNNAGLSEGILDDISDLEKYIVTDDEDNHTKDAQDIWNKIRVKYTDLQPMRMHYMIPLPLQVNPVDIKFQSIQDRAFYQAENKEYSLIYKNLTNGRPIPPMEIMRFMDEIALERRDPYHTMNAQRNMSQLMMILPNLTTELVTKPADAVFKTQVDANATKPDDQEDETPAEEPQN